MKKFAFHLEPLLKLRRNRRDVCRQMLADALRRDDGLVARRNQTEGDRRTQIDELRMLGREGRGIDVDASAARRHYAAQLSGRLGEIDLERAVLAGQIDQCRQALVRADQEVKSLEKLAERKREEFIYDQQRIESRELEQTWQAIHAGERAPC